MVVAALMSWSEFGLEAVPNFAAAGPSTAGTGVIVLIAGLSLLSPIGGVGTAWGFAVGGFTAVLIFVVRLETTPENLSQSTPDLALGAVVGLIGGVIALLGAMLLSRDSDYRPTQQISLFSAAVGAGLAVVATLLLAWEADVFGLDFRNVKVSLDGLSTELITGYPILVLGSAALLAMVFALTRGDADGLKQWCIVVCQLAGVAIALLAGIEVAAKLLLGISSGLSIFSGPLAALAGGILLARSIRPSDPAETRSIAG
ncbi:MAG: hypothetical protein F4124_13225 [Acidimicrobiia bacterium]|nr:hypothetical protein [bacterium]MYI00381.1 hypothetical protein [Acidimicrobiia bacterium]